MIIFKYSFFYFLKNSKFQCMLEFQMLLLLELERESKKYSQLYVRVKLTRITEIKSGILYNRLKIT
ncbi:MAG: hypothetical protein CXT78_10850 [Thaumarchaeota archaeon]|nr:MAG: hypothetical protein CXT78_10850 [Nitrososphaerota archaeon]